MSWFTEFAEFSDVRLGKTLLSYDSPCREVAIGFAFAIQVDGYWHVYIFAVNALWRHWGSTSDFMPSIIQTGLARQFAMLIDNIDKNWWFVPEGKWWSMKRDK